MYLMNLLFIYLFILFIYYLLCAILSLQERIVTCSIFFQEGSVKPSFNARIKEATAHVSASVTPIFGVHWPLVPKTVKKLLKPVTTVLRKILGKEKGIVFSFFEYIR